jgi:tight adherence protein B
MQLIIAILAAIFTFCVIMMLLAALRSEEIATGDRIGKLIKKPVRQDAEDENSKKKAERARRFKAGSKIASQLETAGILLKAEEFIMAWAAATLIPSGLVLFLHGSAITAFGLALVGAIVPPLVVSSARKRRLALFEKQLGDALGIIGNCLRAGFTFQQAMESISNEMPEPISKEFTKTLREMRLGVPMDVAMDSFVRRMCNDDLGMIVSAVLIQRQVGGNLAEIIDNVSVTVRDRLKIKGDVRVLSASGRISGIVIGLLPVFIIGILMVINPTYIMTFFDTTLGIILLMIAGLMEMTGFMLVQKIVSVKY